MSDKTIPFVINDRRKMNADGELRADAPPDRVREVHAAEPVAETPAPAPHLVPDHQPESGEPGDDANMPPPPTAEQMEQSRLAFEATAERLETAIRAANPGTDHPPTLTFESLIQSVYMQAIMQLGGGTQEGQQPQVDILGARQSIDMLTILEAKCEGNLSHPEKMLVDSAIFELRLAFLEITQALARSAQQRAQAPAGPTAAPVRPGPSLIR